VSKKRTLKADPKPRCTRAKQDEAATRTWQATFDAIADSVCTIDRDGKILQCNKAMENFLDMVSADIVGQTCWNWSIGPMSQFRNARFKRLSRHIPGKQCFFP